MTTSPASTGPHGSLVPSQTAAGTQGQCLSGKQGRPRPAQRTPLAFTESMCPVSAARPPPIKVSVCAANLLLEHTHATRDLFNDTSQEGQHLRARRSSRPFLCRIPTVTPSRGQDGGRHVRVVPGAALSADGGSPDPHVCLGPARPLTPAGPCLVLGGVVFGGCSEWGGFWGWSQPGGLGTASVPKAGFSLPIGPDTGLGKTPELLHQIVYQMTPRCLEYFNDWILHDLCSGVFLSKEQF